MEGSGELLCEWEIMHGGWMVQMRSSIEYGMSERLVSWLVKVGSRLVGIYNSLIIM